MNLNIKSNGVYRINYVSVLFNIMTGGFGRKTLVSSIGFDLAIWESLFSDILYIETSNT